MIEKDTALTNENSLSTMLFFVMANRMLLINPGKHLNRCHDCFLYKLAGFDCECLLVLGLFVRLVCGRPILEVPIIAVFCVVAGVKYWTIDEYDLDAQPCFKNSDFPISA